MQWLPKCSPVFVFIIDLSFCIITSTFKKMDRSEYKWTIVCWREQTSKNMSIHRNPVQKRARNIFSLTKVALQGWKVYACLEYTNTYAKSKYRCIFQMLGVGQRTILEHHIVSGKFVLKVGCIAIFIYQNDYYNRIN